MCWWTDESGWNMRLNPGFLPKVISPFENQIEPPAFNDSEPAECSLICLPLMVINGEIKH